MNRYETLMETARQKIANMDAIDGRPISDEPLIIGLSTISTALESAIQTDDWSVVAESQVMLSQILTKQRASQ